MKCLRFGLAAAVLGLTLSARLASAQETFTERPATCEPGYTIVEETAYREVCKKVCHIVPDIRKVKVPVYDMKCEDKCRLSCPNLKVGGKKGPLPPEFACENCYSVDHPPTKCGKIREVRKLIKKEEEHTICHFKCEVENVVSLVPYTVYRKVPCGAASAHPAVTEIPSGSARRSH